MWEWPLGNQTARLQRKKIRARVQCADGTIVEAPLNSLRPSMTLNDWKDIRPVLKSHRERIAAAPIAAVHQLLQRPPVERTQERKQNRQPKQPDSLAGPLAIAYEVEQHAHVHDTNEIELHTCWGHY